MGALIIWYVVDPPDTLRCSNAVCTWNNERTLLYSYTMDIRTN